MQILGSICSGRDSPFVCPQKGIGVFYHGGNGTILHSTAPAFLSLQQHSCVLPETSETCLPKEFVHDFWLRIFFSGLRFTLEDFMNFDCKGAHFFWLVWITSPKTPFSKIGARRQNTLTEAKADWPVSYCHVNAINQMESERTPQGRI